MGLMYVIFLPFISVAMVLELVARKAFLGLRLVGSRLIREATLHWVPGVAHLIWQRRPEKGGMPFVEKGLKEPEKLKSPDRLSGLEEQIAKKRAEERKAPIAGDYGRR